MNENLLIEQIYQTIITPRIHGSCSPDYEKDKWSFVANCQNELLVFPFSLEDTQNYFLEINASQKALVEKAGSYKEYLNDFEINGVDPKTLKLESQIKSQKLEVIKDLNRDFSQLMYSLVNASLVDQITFRFEKLGLNSLDPSIQDEFNNTLKKHGDDYLPADMFFELSSLNNKSMQNCLDLGLSNPHIHRGYKVDVFAKNGQAEHLDTFLESLKEFYYTKFSTSITTGALAGNYALEFAPHLGVSNDSLDLEIYAPVRLQVNSTENNDPLVKLYFELISQKYSANIISKEQLNSFFP